MLEDIERQHRAAQGTGGDKSPATLTPGMPDVTQPPPNHPAYRGASSPQAYNRKNQKSPMDERTAVENSRHSESKEKLDTGQSKMAPKGVPVVSATGLPPQILSGNLLPMFSGSGQASSQEANTQGVQEVKKKLSETLPSSQLSPRGEIDKSAIEKVEPLPGVKPAPLLTPADLLLSSSVLPSSVVTTTSVQEQVC